MAPAAKGAGTESAHMFYVLEIGAIDSSFLVACVDYLLSANGSVNDDASFLVVSREGRICERITLAEEAKVISPASAQWIVSKAAVVAGGALNAPIATWLICVASEKPWEEAILDSVAGMKGVIYVVHVVGQTGRILSKRQNPR